MRPITCSSICASSTSRKAMVGGMGEKCITEMSKNYPQFTQVYSNPEQARVKAYAYHTHLRGTTNQQRENYLGFHQTETYPRGITYDSRNGLCSDKRSSSQHTIQPADRQVQPLAWWPLKMYPSSLVSWKGGSTWYVKDPPGQVATNIQYWLSRCVQKKKQTTLSKTKRQISLFECAIQTTKPCQLGFLPSNVHRQLCCLIVLLNKMEHKLE